MSQSFIGLDKASCKTQVNTTVKENGFTSFYKESASSLIFEISRSSSPYTTLTLDFNKEGWCDLQTQSYLCDTCMYYAYQKIMRNKIYSWKKNKDGTFYSPLSKGIILDVPKDTFLLFRLRKS
ncbi:hypothetical protein [Ferruginibacter sp. SUN106]|uniref:hypothetical protein n=1 Tax=Ferruginibacter sp. SUN106 TaxID=2978348 RepID=UPI003D36423D